MIRIVMLAVLAGTVWRRLTRGRYALGMIGTAGLGLFGAIIGGVLGDALTGGSSVQRDIVAGLAAVGGAVLLVTIGETLARHKRGWPLRGRPPRDQTPGWRPRRRR